MSIDSTIREVMSREFVGVSESDDLVDAGELLREEGVDSGVVLRGNEPVGTIHVRTVLDHLLDGGGGMTVSDAMSNSVERVRADQPIELAVDRFVAIDDSMLVVTNGSENVLGVVTEGDLVRTIALGREPSEREETVTPTRDERSSEAEDNYSEQGICERCGALTGDLASFNGQLLCSDCRDL